MLNETAMLEMSCTGSSAATVVAAGVDAAAVAFKSTVETPSAAVEPVVAAAVTVVAASVGAAVVGVTGSPDKRDRKKDVIVFNGNLRRPQTTGETSRTSEPQPKASYEMLDPPN